MNSLFLRQTLLVSFLAHAALISGLGFSLFPPRAEAPEARLNFFNGIMSAAFERPYAAAKTAVSSGLLRGRTALLPGTARGEFSLPRAHVKPPDTPVLADAKAPAQVQRPLRASLPKRKDASIMFHPLLPYQVQLYFKDRQRVHLELQFMIEPGEERRSISVKRRISSGNLEADLLSARYMQHYLFIQRSRFAPDTWQTVKIDLSAKND